ncbi:MFS transporter [Parachryseolinea silvisoli]|uniref:MFS transporter n=1 Tax=Parachryseolinea silvisoli TaxID=2873601 RepID=UPI002265EA2A|nr:MFS transporter [Parachryseolinea silvisoli]MCD9015728.1 MFS transporter [Parachryseolinea silvisoli]
MKTFAANKQVWLYGWRRTALLTALLFVSIFSQIGRILPFILAESIKKDLQLSDTELGLIMGVAFSICYSLASLPLARLADHGWARRILLGCVLLWSAMTSLGGLATGLVTLALSRLGVALGEAGGTPASHALIAQRIAPHVRGRAIGLFAMGIPLGTMLGFAIGGRASDTIGWRNALFLAGAFGLIVAILVVLLIGKTSEVRKHTRSDENFFVSSRALLSKPAFVWMFLAANLLGFASAPFYTFGAPFLMRTHGLTASEVGISFGLLQGLMGIIGTLLGGRIFDNAVNRRSNRLLDPPAVAFSVAAITTLLALFVPVSWVSIALFVPGMFSFAFLLPHAFGAGHLVAGPGKQALASGLLMLGSGLLPAALSPLLVGMISDAATAANHKNGLQLGMLVVPVFSLLSGIACFVISRKLRTHFNEVSYGG